MLYDHSRKAGNQGDVWKHGVLVSIAARIQAPSPFRYIESHSGAPTHQLRPDGEWHTGIGAVLRNAASDDHPYLLDARTAVDAGRYDASWLFFARVLATRVDRVAVTLCDTSPAVAAEYRPLPTGLFPGNADISFCHEDGYVHVASVEADLVFLDPPFHPDPDADWKALAKTCQDLGRRGISFAAWYPFYSPSLPNELVRATDTTAWEISWHECDEKPRQDLKGCGILMSDSVLPYLEDARAELEWLAESIGGQRQIIIRERSTS